MPENPTSPPAGPTASDPGDVLPYREAEDFEWTEKAYDLIEAGSLKATVTQREHRYYALIEGECPRCGHQLKFTIPISGLVRAGGVRGSGEPVGHVNVDVVCGCGANHPGAPIMNGGCGVAFRVEFEA